MRFIKFVCVFLLVFFLTGCFNYYELNKIAICTGMAIDKSDDGYEITYLVSNAKKQNSNAKEGQAGVTTYSGVGKTLMEATEDINLKIPMHPYYGHLEVIVISEDIAKDGLNDVLDLLLRSAESRKNFYLILSKDAKAKSILQVLSPLESFPSSTISSDIESIKRDSAIAYEITYNDFVSELLDVGIEPILNGITIQGSIDEGVNEDALKNTVLKANIKIEPLGIFRGDKLVDWTSHTETEGINILNNNVNRIVINTDYDDKQITAGITNIKSDIKIDKNLNVKISVTGSASILDTNAFIDLKKADNIIMIEEKLSSKINDITDEGLWAIQKKYKSDVLGFGNIIHKKYPSKWKDVKDDWNHGFFSNLKIEKDVNIKVIEKGSLKQTLEVEENE